MDYGETRRQRAQPRHHVRRSQLRLRLRCAVSLREGGCAGHDHLAGRGMGEISHPAQRDRSRSVSNRRRVVAADAFQAIRGARQGFASDEAFWQARRTHQPRRILLSDMAEYINGECVVIDGGDWLRGAGEFNDLLLIPDAAWESMEAARSKK